MTVSHRPGVELRKQLCEVVARHIDPFIDVGITIVPGSQQSLGHVGQVAHLARRARGGAGQQEIVQQALLRNVQTPCQPFQRLIPREDFFLGGRLHRRQEEVLRARGRGYGAAYIPVRFDAKGPEEHEERHLAEAGERRHNRRVLLVHHKA